MNFKQIYTETRYGEDNLIYRIRLYAPENDSDPYLIKTESGSRLQEDMEETWIVKEFAWNGIARAIRYAISMLDAYVFPITEKECEKVESKI